MGVAFTAYHDLSRTEREQLIEDIERALKEDIKSGKYAALTQYGADHDPYIRRAVSRVLGWLYRDRRDLRDGTLTLVRENLDNQDVYIRQTMVYAVAEIGMADAKNAFLLLDMVIEDESPVIRRAVIGALKRLSLKNPQEALDFAKKYLHHPDPEVRREIVHGIESRGRKHPEEVLPLLGELQNDPSPYVLMMIVHVVGQISYKEECLEKVVAALKTWDNEILVNHSLNEILDVHERYERFCAKTTSEAFEYLKKEFPE